MVLLGPTLRVDKKCLLARSRVSSHEWMFGGHRFSAADGTASLRRIHLLQPRVHSYKAVKTLPQLGTQSFVCLDLVNKDGIPPGSWRVENVQDSRARRLQLVRHIAVPSDCRCLAFQDGCAGQLVGASVDKMDLGMAGRAPARWVYVERAKIAAKLDGFGNW